MCTFSVPPCPTGQHAVVPRVTHQFSSDGRSVSSNQNIFIHLEIFSEQDHCIWWPQIVSQLFAARQVGYSTPNQHYSNVLINIIKLHEISLIGRQDSCQRNIQIFLYCGEFGGGPDPGYSEHSREYRRKFHFVSKHSNCLQWGNRVGNWGGKSWWWWKPRTVYRLATTPFNHIQSFLLAITLSY